MYYYTCKFKKKIGVEGHLGLIYRESHTFIALSRILVDFFCECK